MADGTRNKRAEETITSQLATLSETTARTTADITALRDHTSTQITELKDHTAAKISELSNAIAQLTRHLLHPPGETSSPTQPPPHPPGFTPPLLGDSTVHHNPLPQPQTPTVNRPQIQQPPLVNNLDTPPTNQAQPRYPQHPPPLPNYNHQDPYYTPFMNVQAPPYDHRSQPRPLKLDLPRFDGTDPKGWLFKANQFFDYHQTSHHQRLQIASFHMDGEASVWYQWMQTNYGFVSWHSFAQTLEERFGDSPYKSNAGALAKLTQTSTVTDYISKYEALANRTAYLPPEFLLENFISGLKPHLQQEVQALQPTNILQAQRLAKLQEEKLANLQLVISPSTNHQTSTSVYHPNPAPQQRSQRPLPQGVRRLTAAEMQMKREQGLCFNCPEKFTPGHRCKIPLSLLIIGDPSLVESLDHTAPESEPDHAPSFDTL